MTLVINIKLYLARLEQFESAKPEKSRRPVPTLKEIADSIGYHRISFLRVANNQIENLNLKKAGKVITEMRRRGFDMQISDLLEYVPNGHPPESEATK